jgi:type III pantothenate kinase
VVVDFGTAITYDCVSRDGEYLGGIIAPGVEISMEALTARAAKLPKIDLAPPRSLIAKSTVGGHPRRSHLRLRRPGGRDRRPPAR